MHVNRNFSLLNISLHINKSCMKNGHFINHPAFLFDKCYFYDKDSVMYEQLSKSGNSNLNKRFFKILGYVPLASCSINQIFFGPVDNSSDKKRTDGGKLMNLLEQYFIVNKSKNAAPKK